MPATGEEPLPRRHPPERLAVLCAERPLAFVVDRVLALVVVLLGLTFVVDALCRVFALAARSALVLVLLGVEASEEDRAGLVSLADGFPLDLARLVLLVVVLLLLVATHLLATRDLPDGVAAMEAAIVDGLPWPGGWRATAAVVRKVLPWLVSAAGVGVTAGFAARDWPLTSKDWAYVPLFLLLAEAGVWVAAYLSWVGARPLVNVLPSYVDVSPQRLEDARLAVEEADAAEAARRWPRHRDLRLPTAVTVFAAPPPPLRHRGERRREAWWAGSTTSVEALAVELVLQSLQDAQQAGLVVVDRPLSRNPGVVARLPPDEQPQGLARLVAGHHREGLERGRRVAGKLSGALDPTYGTDQYAAVVRTALEDLEAAGVATRSGEGWQLSAPRLYAVAAQLASATDSRERSRAVVSERDRAILRRHVAARLRGKRTTDVEGEDVTLRMVVRNAFAASDEHRERSSFQLPDPA